MSLPIRAPLARAGLATLFCAGLASASSVDVFFTRVEPHNSSVNPGAQFRCVVSDVAGQPQQVLFTFTNNVGITSSISEIYYDDGPMLGAATLFQTGTSFTAGGASPGNLPGGQNLSPPFNATQQFSADAQGNPALGIDTALDSLGMRFNLINGTTYADVVEGLQSGALRIGLHVRCIGLEGNSDSFVNAVVVPLPPAALTGGLTLTGLVAIVAIRRRRSV